MNEPVLLKDPVVDRWVLISPGRDDRPGARRPPRRARGDGACPFCPGHEAETPPEIWSDRRDGAANTPGWTRRVFANKYPAAPHHEVIVESPRHAEDLSTLSHAELRGVLDVYAARVEAIGACEDVRYVQLFRNAGESAGATQAHPHAQVLGLPMVPPLVREELRGAAAAHARCGTCIYCELATSAPEGDLAVVETAGHVALVPPAPRVAYETWVLPRRHRAAFDAGAEREDLARCLGDALSRIGTVLGAPAYNLVLHHAPRGEEGLPSYHWHLEILPRTTGIAGFELASGVYVNPVAPVEASRALVAASAPGRRVRGREAE